MYTGWTSVCEAIIKSLFFGEACPHDFESVVYDGKAMWFLLLSEGGGGNFMSITSKYSTF